MARVKLTDRIYDPADAGRVTTLAQLAEEGRVEFTTCDMHSARSASGKVTRYLAEIPETAKNYPEDSPYAGERESVSCFEIGKAAYLSRTGADVAEGLTA